MPQSKWARKWQWAIKEVINQLYDDKVIDTSNWARVGHYAKRKILLIMTVEIGDGRSDTIYIKRDDTPLNLAKSFVTKHNLDERVVKPLTAHIHTTLYGEALSFDDDGPDSSKPVSEYEHLVKNKDVYMDRVNRREQEETETESEEEEPPPPQPKLAQPKRQSFQPKPKPPPPEPEVEKIVTEEEVVTFHYNSTSESEDEKEPKPAKVINPVSEAIVAGQRSGVSRFDHMYEAALESRRKIEEARKRKARLEEEELRKARRKPKASEYSKALMEGRSLGNFKNYGEKMYYEGLQARQRKEREAEEARLAKLQAEESELRFKPQISNHAKKSDRSSLWGRGGEHHENCACRNRDMKECTFQPKLGEVSKKLASRRGGRGSSKFDDLYEDAMRRRSRQKEYEGWVTEDHTFHPELSEKARRLKGESENGFIDRLVNEKRNKDEHLRQVREKLAEQTERDPETGQPFFKPRVGRGPMYERKPDPSMRIEDVLYASRYEFEDIKGRLAEQHLHNLKEKASAPKLGPTSRKLINDIRLRRLRDIFDKLDTDGDDLLIPPSVDGSRLEREVAKDVVPFLERQRGVIDFDRFVLLMESEFNKEKVPKAWMKWNPNRKKHACEFGHDHHEHTFRPRVGTVSSEIAHVKRRRPDDVPIHEALFAEHRDKESKHAEIQRRKEAEELEGCTFHPNIPVAKNAWEEGSVSSAGGDKRKMSKETLQRLVYSSRDPRYRKEPARHRDEDGMTTIEREVREHCTFKPQLNWKTVPDRPALMTRSCVRLNEQPTYLSRHQKRLHDERSNASAPSEMDELEDFLKRLGVSNVYTSIDPGRDYPGEDQDEEYFSEGEDRDGQQEESSQSGSGSASELVI